MDNSLLQTLNGQDPLPQNNAPNMGTGVSTAAPATTPSQPTGPPTQNSGDLGTEAPVKRKPGRPKGSVNKPTLAGAAGETVDPAAKIKRPVGRPRKDGLPAGSVSGSRPRPRKSEAMGGRDVQMPKHASTPAGSSAFGGPGVC